MHSLGGLKPFFKGTSITIIRDMVFGGTYEVLRYTLAAESPNKKYYCTEWISNLTAAGVATIVSSPLNYVRNRQYGTEPHLKTPAVSAVLTDLWQESKNNNQQPFSRIRFFQQRCKIGWSSARVAVSMALGQKIFDCSKARLNELYEEEATEVRINNSL